MNTKLHPKHDFVAVAAFDHTPAVRGIVLPDQVRKNRSAQAGRVLAVGPGRQTEYGPFIAVTCKVGDIVLFPKGAGISFDDEDAVRLVRDCELIGVLEESPIIEAAP